MHLRRVLVALPDLPGSLGRVTTLLGRLCVDIQQVRVLTRSDGTATDEFVVALPGPVVEAGLVDLIEELEGVRVVAVGPVPVEAGERYAGRAACNAACTIRSASSASSPSAVTAAA